MRRLSRVITLLLICSISIFMACEGPSGTEGPQGPEGPEGPVGPAGEDGSMIYSGSGAPGSDIGSNGDYYLNTDNGDFYGPKDDSGWGNPVIALQGEEGEDGSQIHAGSGAPDASLGSVGDYYLDKDTYELYGPKTDSGWGTPLNLKGTANVMYSAWFEAGSWTESSSDHYYFDEAAASVTQEIIDQGTVLAYAKLDGDGSNVRPLPATTINTNKILWGYHITGVGNIRFTATTVDGSSLSPLSTNEYRYVIIPGGTSVSSKAKKEKLKDMSYEEVKKRFGIKD